VPFLERPDGALIHWDERGDGPLVVFATHFFGYPGVFESLIADLARDHRVITYDPRGMGQSSSDGSFDMATDVDDLGVLIEEVGGPALLVGMGDGINRAVVLASERPELVTAVLSPGGNPIGRLAAEGTDALVDSPAVLKALVGMMETDYRAALRTMVSSANPQMTEEEARDRVDRVVAYCPQDTGAARLRGWIKSVPLDEARVVGDRLWLLVLKDDNPWFPNDTTARTRELLPEANIEIVDDGPISRPDLTADVIRGITASRPGVSTRAIG
jgi:pimeloyl-ACP methyl ester carboxylesterase